MDVQDLKIVAWAVIGVVIMALMLVLFKDNSSAPKDLDIKEYAKDLQADLAKPLLQFSNPQIYRDILDLDVDALKSFNSYYNDNFIKKEGYPLRQVIDDTTFYNIHTAKLAEQLTIKLINLGL